MCDLQCHLVHVSAGFLDLDSVLCGEWTECPSGTIPVTTR